MLEVVVDKKEDLYRLVLLMLVLMILMGVYFYVDIYDYFYVDFDVKLLIISCAVHEINSYVLSRCKNLANFYVDKHILAQN